MSERAHPLRKCIATVALSGSLPDKLEAAAAIGFDGVEIMEADLLTFDGSPSDVRRIAESLGIDLYQPFRDFEAMPDPVRGRNSDRAERKFDDARALVVGCGGLGSAIAASVAAAGLAGLGLFDATAGSEMIPAYLEFFGFGTSTPDQPRAVAQIRY